jgi:hypothetical protein
MHLIRRLGLFTLLAAALVTSGAFATKPSELAEAMSHDGLQKISVKGLDLAYALPGATLAGYRRVQLDPVQVAFRKDWDPTRTGSRMRLSTEERENIRAGLAQVVQEAFVTELQRHNSYPVVDEAGPDVLRVKVHIVDLYVNAPDTPTAARSSTYVMSAGEMSLFAELSDAETGQTLVRVVDRREARDTGQLKLTNAVLNRGEAQDIAAAWARILRRALDKAHGIGTK